MEVLNDILGYPNRKIYQNTDFFSFSLDSVMLANFVTIRLRDKEILDLGRIKIKSPQGQYIDVYDVERCLCDCLKDKDMIASEYIKEAFNIYFKDMRKDTFKIMKYAKKLGIEKEMHNYLEVLL